jgi:curved DNA-binding protein CbpA
MKVCIYVSLLVTSVCYATDPEAYTALNVMPRAKAAAIKLAYKKKIAQLSLGGTYDKKAYEAVNKAYAILNDHVTRMLYDWVQFDMPRYNEAVRDYRRYKELMRHYYTLMAHGEWNSQTVQTVLIECQQARRRLSRKLTLLSQALPQHSAAIQRFLRVAQTREQLMQRKFVRTSALYRKKEII